MLSKVEVRPQQGNLLTLLLSNPDNGFIVRGIEGLGPVKAELVSTSYARMDGAQPMSARRGERDILITLGIDPRWGIQTVEELRRALYRFFMPKMYVDLTFFTDTLNVVINGQIESMDPVLFTEDPEVTISIRCYDPDFIDPTVRTEDGWTGTDADYVTIDYQGSVDTGFVFQIVLADVMSQFTVEQRINGSVVETMEFVGGLFGGNIVDVSTVPGNKFVHVTDAGYRKSALFMMSPYSPWLTLKPGTNEIRIQSDAELQPWSMTWTDRHGGL